MERMERVKMSNDTRRCRMHAHSSEPMPEDGAWLHYGLTRPADHRMCQPAGEEIAWQIAWRFGAACAPSAGGSAAHRRHSCIGNYDKTCRYEVASRRVTAIRHRPMSRRVTRGTRVEVQHLQEPPRPDPPSIPASQASPRRSSNQLSNQADFDRHLQRERVRSNGTTCMLALFPEDFDEKIAAAIDDCGLVSKVVWRIHEAFQFDDLLDIIEIATSRLLKHGYQLQADHASNNIAIGSCEFDSNLALILCTVMQRSFSARVAEWTACRLGIGRATYAADMQAGWRPKTCRVLKSWARLLAPTSVLSTWLTGIWPDRKRSFPLCVQGTYDATGAATGGSLIPRSSSFCSMSGIAVSDSERLPRTTISGSTVRRAKVAATHRAGFRSKRKTGCCIRLRMREACWEVACSGAGFTAGCSLARAQRVCRVCAQTPRVSEVSLLFFSMIVRLFAHDPPPSAQVGICF